MKKPFFSVNEVKPTDPDTDDVSFRDVFADVAPLKQDKIPPRRPQRDRHTSELAQKKAQLSQEQAQRRQAAASFHFSDGFEAHFDERGPIKYVKPGADTFEVKRLRRGEYPPDLILDLHGYKREDAKLEIAALIEAAKKQQVYCVCIVHGIGSHVLKKTVPNWLVQHPSVVGFHQATLEWGGQGALLVLIEQTQRNGKY